MGCTPSIHVSQTGVVYCRESDDSTSPRPAAYGGATYHAHVVRREGGDTPADTVPPKSKKKREDRKGTSAAAPAESDGQSSLSAQNADSDICFGTMRIPQKPMTVLLVFHKEDAQSDSLWQAAERLGYSCSLALTPDAALEEFTERHHDVIIIDRRTLKALDADTVCRSLRATKFSDFCVIIGITKASPLDKEEASVLPMLKMGFNRRFVENTDIGVCMNELHQLTHGEVRTQRKLRACAALITALDDVSDAVEISSDDHRIQYVNRTYERLTGYSGEELVGRDTREVSRSDRSRDSYESMLSQTKKGKHWEGTYYTRRKSGEAVPYHCRVTPVLGPGSKPCQYVSVRMASSDTLNQIANGGVHGVPRRRESVARIHSMTIEAPITKVINMINVAQESSPATVVQALDKVLEILRTSELYAPHLPPQLGRDDDPMTSDLVGGLVSQNMKRRMSGNESQHQRTAHHGHPQSLTPLASLSQIPEHVQSILEREPTWDFDIIQLEEATNKRPLVYLGLKTFARFAVCEFLSIPESVLVAWLQLIESSYHDSNHYHNSTHAADVLHASAYFLECERTKTVFDAADCVACLIAAAVHDVDHPARTNAFLVNEGNQLALLYNDLAVLENHHASLAFRLTHKDPSVNIFQNLSREDYRSLRQSIIDMVLATEMKQHFEHLSKFTHSINKTVLKCEDEASEPSSGSFDNETIFQQLSTPENRTLIKRMLIKCADVSNPVRPTHLCSVWAERIAEEYCQQTDEEKERGLPVVMAVFDRKTCSIPKSQTSFIDVFINDMFGAWDYYCDIPELMNHLQVNYQYWKAEEERQNRGKNDIS